MFELGRRIACFAFLLATIVGSTSSRCEEHASPFVAGFDRFARHGHVEQVRGGQLLISELSCAACHQMKIELLQPKLGPRLNGVGDRIQRDWLRRFLASPSSVKPGTTMPEILAGLPSPKKEQAVDALVAFLSAQHEPFPILKATGANPLPHEFWKKGNRDRGQQMFHQIGCVACHQPDERYDTGQTVATQLDQLLKQLDPEEIKEMGLAALALPVLSVPHGDLPAKYNSQSLTFFLLNPEHSRPSGRMPNFKLTPVEAADIAAYLLWKQEPPDTGNRVLADESIVRKGQRLFSELRCVNCHAIKGAEPTRFAKPLGELNSDETKSCYGGVQRELPHFKLDQTQTQAIDAALRGLQASRGGLKASPQQEVDFRLMQLNCYACHQRGELGGVGRNRRKYLETVGHVDLGDEGRFPPSLSGIGRKLKPTWIQRVLTGTGDLRPHMLARMPKYPNDAVAFFPGLFLRADAAEHPSEKDVFGERGGLADAGRMLLDAGCVQCHPVRGESLPGVAGVDLAGIASRVQPAWFRDFLLNPEQLKRGTRMPTFFPNGKSSSMEVLGGNVDKQLAAVWTYLKEIDKHPLPPKLLDARSRDFELVPNDRPIVLRTFMQHAGTHAIAVGYPQKVHFAFDAENVRLAQAWRGRFLDAYGTWFERFAPPADPLGSELKMMPAGVSLALLKNKQEPWPTSGADDMGYQFQGYRFDRSGVPTFLYRLGRYDIEDRIEPNASQGLSRRLRIVELDQHEKTDGSLWFRVNVGKSLQQKTPNSYTNDVGLTSIVSEKVARLGIIRKLDGQSEWIIPITVDGEATIEVEYQW